MRRHFVEKEGAANCHAYKMLKRFTQNNWDPFSSSDTPTIAGCFYRGNWTAPWNAYTCVCGQSWKNRRPAYSPSMLQRNKWSLVQKDRNMFAKAVRNIDRIATSDTITDKPRAHSIYDAEAFPFSYTQALHTLQGWGSFLTSSHHFYWELANS